MQYLLSQEEWGALKRRERASVEMIKEVKDKVIQDLCIMIAENIPGKEDRIGAHSIPHGCYLSRELELQTSFCNFCPVEGVCPNPNKRYK